MRAVDGTDATNLHVYRPLSTMIALVSEPAQHYKPLSKMAFASSAANAAYMKPRQASKRGTKAWGRVNFPLTNPRFHDSGAGGVYVLLVVGQHLNTPPDSWAKLLPEVQGMELLGAVTLSEGQFASDVPSSSSSGSPYLAAFSVGAVDWVGVDESTGRAWVCDQASLNHAGALMVRKLQQSFAGHPVHLLTYRRP